MAQNPIRPPKISTKNSNKQLSTGSPRQRSLTFGSTSEKAASSKNLPDSNTEGPEPTLSNLAVYLDWRNAKFNKDDVNADLWKIAQFIWEFLPVSTPVPYILSFNDAKKHSVVKGFTPPVRVVTSVSGDILYCFYSKKQYIDYADTSTIIVLMPYIDSISMVGVSNWETLSKSDRCTWWEVERTQVSHIGFDKDDHIYFTNGESVYRIMTIGDKMYRESYDEIWAVDGDTSHITSLWRQGDQLYFTTQDWEKEDHLDLWKVKYGKGSGRLSSAASPTSPGGGNAAKFQARGRAHTGRSNSANNTPRNHARNHSGSIGRSGGGSRPTSPRRSGSVDNELNISKVRTFSLEYNDRVWQLTWLRYEKKFLLGIAACRGGTQPQLMQISFKKKLKLIPLGAKHYQWPIPYEDSIPHDFIYHRPTRTWLLYLAVFSTKEGKDPTKNKKRYWIQFRLDAAKRKVVWHRLIELQPELCIGEWVYYDEIRDVLIGWQCTNEKEKTYTLQFLPDVSKMLWVEMKESDSKENDDEKGNDKPNINPNSKSVEADGTVKRKGKRKGNLTANANSRVTTKGGKNSKSNLTARPRSAAARGHAKSTGSANSSKGKGKTKGKGKSKRKGGSKSTKKTPETTPVVDSTMD